MERPEVSPLLKWAGSKRWLVARLTEFYKRTARLVDPFVGSMSVPFFLKPENALLSDVNPHLMNLYRWLQHGLIWEENCGVDFIYNRPTYYENRAKFNALCSQREYWTKEGALLFYYLNRTCFNGLCRFNKSGFFNTPIGSYEEVNFKYDFSQYKAAMEGWELYSGDFESLPIKSDDWIYSDPPYDVEFTQFAPKDFVWADQERLAKWLARHPGVVLASNSYTKRIVELYKDYGFKIFVGEAPRFISCTGDRTPALEILAFKNYYALDMIEENNASLSRLS